MPKKRGNADSEESSHQSDLEDHEYAGIEHISCLSDGDSTKVFSIYENLNLHNTVMNGHYEETSSSLNENDHDYMELKWFRLVYQGRQLIKGQVIPKLCTEICDQNAHHSNLERIPGVSRE